MNHCCKFKADDTYFLADTEIYPQRKLSIGFCPICGKPIAELVQIRFDNVIERQTYSGIKANDIVVENQDSILYSANECNYRRFKSRPFGWKYGVNKSVFVNGKALIRQYAHDFYGNEEIVKEIKE